MNKSLYNIEQEYITLATQIIESEGEISEEIQRALEINEHELDHKLTGYAQVIKQNKADINTIDEEIKRLQKEKNKRENLENRLKTSIENAMTLFDINKFENIHCKLSFRKSTVVDIEDIDILPIEFIKFEKKVLKSEIKEALKTTKITGAKLVNNKSLQIK